jgi:hypothetical protein
MDPHDDQHLADGAATHTVDWRATIRLGLAASGVAGLAAAALHGVVSDGSIITWVVVASGAASWLQLHRYVAPALSH